MTSTELLHLADCLNCVRDGCHSFYCKQVGSSYSSNSFRYMWATACCPSLIDSAAATRSLPDSAGITPPPSTAPAAATFPMETWMGNRTSQWAFIPDLYCSAITEATSLVSGAVTVPASGRSWDYTSVRTTQTFRNYQNNLTDWDNGRTSRWCRPELPSRTIGSADFWYPASCPIDWTSYMTKTTITSSRTSSRVVEVFELVFDDAMCCPKSYTSHFAADSRYYCTRSLPKDDAYWIATWTLWASIEALGSDAEIETDLYRLSSTWGGPELAVEGLPTKSLTTDTVLTYWPMFVRYHNFEYIWTPTATAPGAAWTEITGSAQVDSKAAKKRLNEILHISLPVGLVVVALLVLLILYYRHFKRQERKREKREKAQAEERGMRGEEALMSGAGTEMRKPELMGDMYVGPGYNTGDQMDKPELEGKTVNGSGRAIITSLEELKYDEIKEDDGTELDHQTRRPGVADAELEAREQERRAAELEAGRSIPRRIARKQVPDRGQSYVSSISLPQQSPAPESFPHSPILSGPMPDFTAMYPAPIDPEAEEEEKRLEYQEQRLRERREQLAREEEVLRQKRAQKRGGV